MRAAFILPITLSLLSALSAPAQAAGDGLQLTAGSDPWPQWQARLSVVAQPVAASTGLGNQLQIGAARLAGDHYFAWGRLGETGGLRATSALLLGPSAQAMAAPSPWNGGALRSSSWNSNLATPETDTYAASAYLGLGYSAWWARSGLGLSADLGLVAQRTPSALRLGRSDTVDSAWHGLQMSPVFQVNLSYAF